MPLAARRVLDALGRKLSLKGWLSLSVDDRARIVEAGARERVDANVVARLERATPLPTRIPPVPEPDASAAPALLVAALGPERPLDDGSWRSLHPLDRYTLIKTAAKPERLAAAYASIVVSSVPRLPSGSAFTHLSPSGEAHMVDIAAKPETHRRAVASACVRTTGEVIRAVASATMPKGDVLAVARVAGILAAKGTPGLVPLCHPVRITRSSIEFECAPERGELRVRAEVEAFDRTGVEMEAMAAASIAALTVYDMIKAADRWATIQYVRLEEKTGGKSGDVRRSGLDPGSAAPSAAVLVALRETALSVDEARGHIELRDGQHDVGIPSPNDR
jgi:cyclic pyranopterin phosphate synthase